MNKPFLVPHHLSEGVVLWVDMGMVSMCVTMEGGNSELRRGTFHCFVFSISNSWTY